jgi:hypothetical protein
MDQFDIGSIGVAKLGETFTYRPKIRLFLVSVPSMPKVRNGGNLARLLCPHDAWQRGHSTAE